MKTSCALKIEERLIELETKVSFQDRTIEVLNDTVADLQLELQNLQRILAMIKRKLPQNVESVELGKVEL